MAGVAPPDRSYVMDKLCVRCKRFHVGLGPHDPFMGCSKGYWELEKNEDAVEFREKCRMAERCLEYRFVLTP